MVSLAKNRKHAKVAAQLAKNTRAPFIDGVRDRWAARQRVIYLAACERMLRINCLRCLHLCACVCVVNGNLFQEQYKHGAVIRPG